MLEPRLAAEIQVHALLKKVGGEGGFGAVMRKGDRISGSIMIICLEKGQNPVLLERMPSLEGPSNWQQTWPQGTENKQELDEYLERRTKYDPDIWIIELDVPDAQRLIVQMGQLS